MPSIWGEPQVQSQPVAVYQATDGGSSAALVTIPAESSRVNVNLALEYRQKGLLWYSVYVVDFDGTYQFRNTSGAGADLPVGFSLQTSHL